MIRKFERLAFSILGKRYMPVWLILMIDLSMVVGSFFFGWLLMTNFKLYHITEPQRMMGLVLLVVCYGISFVLFRSYEGAFRHTGVRDLMRLF
jgi:FlaA1/EpsC-like NDP-sugar epimerase